MTRSCVVSVVVLSLVASHLVLAQEAVPTRAAATQAVAEAQKLLRAALEAARVAEATARQAEGDEARQAAAEKAKAAAEKLAAAQKLAARQAALAQEAAAAAQAVIVRGGAYGAGGTERDAIDPQDPVERFALLTPGGPLIVQAALTIDGQPFRTAREKLVAEMLSGADKNKDGETTWAEAAMSARFTLGRAGLTNEQQRSSLVSIFDKNMDRVVQPAEAWQFLAQSFQGPAFSLGSGSPTGGVRVLSANGQLYAAGGAQPDLLALLDTNKDRALDKQELAAAAERLKTRDADDNDVLDAAEISGQGMSPAQRVIQTGQQPAQNAILLGPAAVTPVVFTALQQRYKNADGKLAAGCFPLFPQLFAALDKDRSGEIAADEALGLNDVAPHVELTVDLATQKTGEGLKIKALTADVKLTGDAVEKKELELPGLRVSLAASVAAAPSAIRNFEQIGNSLLMRYDKDGNGYLEASEMQGAAATQFAMFDGNEDGKAYPAEIAAGYARQYAPQATQVLANVVQQGNSLFQTLDASGDNRLSLREMRAAAERIAAMDKDQDGQIAGREIPETIAVSFNLGSANTPFGDRTVIMQSQPGRPAAAATGAPEWFTRMDRNNDGDVTLKEFLGGEADFKRLDANGDGFLEPAEAKAAK